MANSESESGQATFLTEASLRLLLFGGKGGVGKTTLACASALAWAEAEPNRTVRLLSTDPAHSTTDSLGGACPENLILEEVDAEALHQEFVEQHAETLRQIAERGTFLEGDEIDRFLELSLPGVDELMAFLRIAQLMEDYPDDRIVVDTAPTGHTLRLLDMPTFLSGWTDAADSLLAKHRYMRGMFGAEQQQDDTDAFLQEFTASFETLGKAMRDPTVCAFVPVTIAELMGLEETADLMAFLTESGLAVRELVFNRVTPREAGQGWGVQRQREQECLKLAATRFAGTMQWAVPRLAEEAIGAEGLRQIVKHITPAKAWAEASVEQAESAAPLRLEQETDSAEVTEGLEQARLFFMAGKGGVGKTTVSCMTALALRDAELHPKIRLISIDPAHSLADCLGVPLSDAATEVVPGLEAEEIDPHQEFERFKDDYREELEGALSDMIPGFDLTYDREAMTRLIDLSPPGLDEVMAVIRVLDLLDAEPDTVIVLDTAPTGHLLRFLETPELLQAWVDALFDLLMKYDHMIRMPRLMAELVRIAKGLKGLQKCLTDHEATQVHIVSIPTRSALSETGRLAESLRALDALAARLVVNQLTPESDSTWAKQVRAQEQGALSEYRQKLSGLPIWTLEKQGDPRGVDGLRALASRLQRPHSTSSVQTQSRVA